MDDIKKYYRLCGVYSPDNQPRPLVDQIEKHAVSVIFTNKQANLYIKKSNNGDESVTIKEDVVGGRKKPRDGIAKALVV